MGLLGKSNAPERGCEHKKQSFGRWREEKETELDVKLRRLSKKEKSKLSKPDFDKDFQKSGRKRNSSAGTGLYGRHTPTMEASMIYWRTWNSL